MAAPVTLVTQDIRWHVLPDWADVLLSDQGLREDIWEAAGCRQAVKQGEHRTVHRVQVADRAFHVKHYRCPRWINVLKNLIRPCGGWREWTKTLEARRRGVLTIRPIAWGRRTRRGLVRDSFFIAETVPDACSLEEFIGTRLRHPGGQRAAGFDGIVDSLARFTAEVHRAGICHNDFHPGNILIRRDDNDPLALPQLYLIDLPGVRFSGPLDWPATRQNLATLSAACGEAVGEDLQRRFWRAYVHYRSDLALPSRRLAVEQIQDLATRLRRDNLRRRDRRAWRTNRDYVALADATGEAHAVRGLSEGELRRWFADADGPLWENLHRPVRITRGSVAVEADLPSPDGPIRVVYARYDASDWRQAVGGWFGQSEALRQWYLGHALRARALPTARPLAVCQPRSRWGAGSGYLATECIDRAVPLDRHLRQLDQQAPARRLRAAAKLTACLGRLLGQMHANQVYLRRWTGASILVVQNGDAPETHLADVGEARIARRLHRAQRLADLSGLGAAVGRSWLSPTTCLRFLRAYLAEQPGEGETWKPLWRELRARLPGRARQGPTVH